MKVGIIGYGVYIPEYRIKAEEIAAAWNEDIEKIKSGLLIHEKAVAGKDEDTATIAVAAAQNALIHASINASQLGALYIGSESHPYVVKPTSTIVGAALGLSKNFMTADLEFACKGGTAAIQVCYAFVKAGMVDYALAIGADTAQSSPGDVLEYSAAAGGAAFILGNNEKDIIATIDATLSITTDTPDFWRRNGQKYPVHTGRFTGEPSYFAHVIEATQKMLTQTGLQPRDFDYVVFHQPNGKFPIEAAKRLGFTSQQLETGLLVRTIGNSYSAISLLGLAAVLDQAQPGQKILVTSYGSGSGSDVFVLTTTNQIVEKQKRVRCIKDYCDRKKYISYLAYRTVASHGER